MKDFLDELDNELQEINVKKKIETPKEKQDIIQKINKITVKKVEKKVINTAPKVVFEKQNTNNRNSNNKNNNKQVSNTKKVSAIKNTSNEVR